MCRRPWPSPLPARTPVCRSSPAPSRHAPGRCQAWPRKPSTRKRWIRKLWAQMNKVPAACRYPSVSRRLLEIGERVLGVLQMALENLQAGFLEALQFGVAGCRNQLLFERAIDRLVEGDFVGNIGLVVSRAAQLGELLLLVRSLLGERAAGVVVFRRDLQLLDEIERLLVDRLVVAHHVLGEGDDFLVLRFRQCLLGGSDVVNAGSVGDVSDLRIGEFRALRESGCAQKANSGESRAELGEHNTAPVAAVE